MPPGSESLWGMGGWEVDTQASETEADLTGAGTWECCLGREEGRVAGAAGS